MQLHERFRPSTWDDVVGQDHAKAAIDAVRETQGLGGQSFWISGPSGVGKTTIAKLIAHEIAEDWFIREMDAGELTANELRDIERGLQLTALGKGGRALIINEAHGLRPDVIRLMLVVLERLRGHVVVIFTTTTAGEAELMSRSMDWRALLSRCVDVRLNQTIEGGAKRLQRIAKSIKLDAHATLRNCEHLLNEHEHNMRAAIQAIGSGVLNREFTPSQLW